MIFLQEDWIPVAKLSDQQRQIAIMRVFFHLRRNARQDFGFDYLEDLSTEGDTLRLRVVFYSSDAQKGFQQDRFVRRVQSELKRVNCGKCMVTIATVLRDRPVPVDLAAAKARVEEDSRQRWEGIEPIRESIEAHFRDKYALRYVFIFPIEIDGFHVYLFFNTNEDAQRCERCNGIREIEKFVYAEIERGGRGKKTDVKVKFEVDSDENVSRDFEGNYNLRLR